MHGTESRLTSMKGGTARLILSLSVYYYHSVCVVADAAKLLNKREDCIFYRELKEKIKSRCFQGIFYAVRKTCRGYSDGDYYSLEI